MFESVDVAPLDADAPVDGGVGFDEDWCEPARWERVPEPEEVGQIPAAECLPSGWLALELDQGAVDPARLSDAELIDAMVGFDRVAAWAGARQAGLLAEFARRRPAGPCPPGRSEVPTRHSGYAADEVALALRLSRTAAANRMTMAEVLDSDLPGTLELWAAGGIDVLKVRAIAEASYPLAPGQRAALERRVLPRAGKQTLAQLRACLGRGVLAIDPDGAQARYEQRRTDRRVVVEPDAEGMATLWALLSAPDAVAAYQRLCELARGLGAADPRGMDARRADLLVDLLTGRQCAGAEHAATQPPESEPCAETTADTGDATADSDQATVDTGEATPGEELCRASTAGSTRPGKPLISVIVPITMLLGLDEQPGELAGYGPIPAALAREIAAEGTWRRLLTDPVSGALLDYGRSTYTPPKSLADFVRARDVHCRNPICGQPAATADLDHTVPWPDGPTSAHNIHAACRRDHLIKTHSPGWHVEQDPDGTITWTTPTGHTYTGHPHDYRPQSRPLTPDATRGHDPPEDDPPPF